MSPEPDSRIDDRGLRRIAARSRLTLAVAGLVLLVLGLRAPELWPELLAGFVAVAIASELGRGQDRQAPAPGIVRSQDPVWPDSGMKSLSEAIDAPAFILDRNTVLHYANAAAAAAFGQPRIGDPIGFRFRSPDIARVIGDAIAAGERQSMEYHDATPPGHWYWMSVAPVPGSDPPRHFLLTFVDFTHTRRADQMRSDFIANASHELRTPLASLRGFIETIQGPADGDRKATRRFLALMLEQAERMSRLIDDLLSLSRIEMKAHVRPTATVDLGGVLRHVADTMAPLATDLSVAMETDLPEDPLPVTGDQDELIQVFENLVENACKYGQTGGRVLLSARIERPQTAGPRVIATVRDFGPGIAAEHLPRLTERFYRAGMDAEGGKRGTGLGLAIVKHILTRHGTRLTVVSAPGEGAAFSVAMPLLPAGTSSEARENSGKRQMDRLS